MIRSSCDLSQRKPTSHKISPVSTPLWSGETSKRRLPINWRNQHGQSAVIRAITVTSVVVVVWRREIRPSIGLLVAETSVWIFFTNYAFFDNKSRNWTIFSRPTNGCAYCACCVRPSVCRLLHCVPPKNTWLHFLQHNMLLTAKLVVFVFCNFLR